MISGCATYRAGVALPETDTPVGALSALSTGHGRVAWIGLSDPPLEEVQRLSHLLGLEGWLGTALETPGTRAHLETRGDDLLLTAGVARYDHGRDLVEIGGLSILVRPDMVVTLTHHAPPEIRDLRRAIEADPDDLVRGPAGIVHAHLDAVIDGYAAVLRDLRGDVETLERKVFTTEADASATQRIYLLKREAIDFQQATAALIDPLEDLADGSWSMMTGVTSLEWAALRDRLVRLVDRADGLSDLLTGVLTAYQTDVALRQNEDMRKISAWVAIAAVPTMLAGIYGMNFESMPELTYQYGYPILIGVMVVLSVGLYAIFRSNKWL